MAIDQEVRAAIDTRLLPWEGVTSRSMFGGTAYMIQSKMFAILMEGMLAMKLPDELRSRALTLAGVSPFRSPSGGPFGQWVQFVILLEDDVPAVVPWLESASSYVASLPAARKRARRSSS